MRRSIGWVTPLLLLVGGGNVFGVAPFTVVALPDTQYYTQSDTNNVKYFQGQTKWIVNNRASKNIAFVLGLGDIQNDGNQFYARTDNPYEPDFTRPTGLVVNDNEWIRARASLDILKNAGVPQSIIPGNHDYVDNTIKEEPIYYLKYFGPQTEAGLPWFKGSSPEAPGSLAGMDKAYLFDAGGRKFLNIGLQYAPDVHDLTWAQSIINQYPGVPTIITTHAMLTVNSQGQAAYQSGRTNIRDQLFKLNPQVIMTINGHINGAARQTENNLAGLPVQEMLVDYQSTAYPGLFKGGGYMRLMEFDQDNSVVHVKSYSPVANNYLTDATNQFDLPMDLNGRFGVVGASGYTKTVRVQQGKNGYSGTVDTYVDASNASSTSGATAQGIWVDGDADSATSGNQPRHGLIRFNGVTGAGGMIPAGAVIRSAKLILTTSGVTDAQTNSTMSLYRMVSSWGNTPSWNSLGSGVQTGSEAILAANGTVTPTEQGMVVEFDVTESLYAWSVGAPNQGWAVLPGGNDGWRFDSAEGINVDTRPVLEVTYFVVPEPGFGAFVVLGGIMRLGRRR